MVTITFHISEEQCYPFSKQGSCYVATRWDENPKFIDATAILGLYSTVCNSALN